LSQEVVVEGVLCQSQGQAVVAVVSSMNRRRWVSLEHWQLSLVLAVLAHLLLR
jgi:hypothetical protein